MDLTNSIESLRPQLDALLASDWIRQICVLLGATLLSWPLTSVLVARARRAEVEGRGAAREQRLVGRLAQASLWPLLAMALTALGLKIFERIEPSFIPETGRVLAILGFLLVFRLVDTLIREFVTAGPRRRRLRRGVVPALFLLLILQQLQLLAGLLDWLQRPWLTVREIGISPFSILSATAVVLGALVIGRLVFLVLGNRFLPGFGVDRGLGEAIATVVRYAVIIIGFLWALEIVGFDLTTVKIAFGALGVGIGFGLQTIVNNFVSGLILMFERSVKRGDILTVGGIDGKVENIGLRASVLRTRQGDDMILPNSQLVSNEVTNYSFRDLLKRVDVEVGVSYRSDPNRVREILLEVARGCDEALPDPEPRVLFMAFGESSLNFQLRVWIDDAWMLPQVRSRLLFDIWYALKAESIEIPFPQRDLHVRSGDLGIRLQREADG